MCEEEEGGNKTIDSLGARKDRRAIGKNNASWMACGAETRTRFCCEQQIKKEKEKERKRKRRKGRERKRKKETQKKEKRKKRKRKKRERRERKKEKCVRQTLQKWHDNYSLGFFFLYKGWFYMLCRFWSARLTDVL